MHTEEILALLIAERDRLNNAIAALQGSALRGRRQTGAVSTASPTMDSKTTGEKRSRRGFTALQRKQQSERMKAYWAAIRGGVAEKRASRASRKKA